MMGTIPEASRENKQKLTPPSSTVAPSGKAFPLFSERLEVESVLITTKKPLN
jgi:hypothetical protein